MDSFMGYTTLSFTISWFIHTCNYRLQGTFEVLQCIELIISIFVYLAKLGDDLKINTE